jgi:hypothetical protein
MMIIYHILSSTQTHYKLIIPSNSIQMNVINIRPLTVSTVTVNIHYTMATSNVEMNDSEYYKIYRTV